ncbi:head maturation protease, ClpP-related [Agrobacterium tumefaciens]|uniref:head maturation protease, ClpP-related n=1 Tax=Agrobacterium tumefaciens TaxID=358 RepID=UPI00045A4F0D|nr:head maturation protease, ClpP-related [Agrobacterium tumefaciens]CDN94807.1 putative Clp protease protein [Agrobacterium tumefaciens]
MTNRLIKNGELHLYGTVGGDWTWDEDGIVSTGFTDEQVIEALADLSGDIVVRLNSGGGIAFQGIAIYNALKSHDGKVSVFVDALAASAASLIAMAGDHVVMRPGAMMMIHNPGTITIGTSEDHRKAALTLDQIAASAAEIYASRSGRSMREILRMMADETWMRGSVARSLGFAEEAEESGEEMAAPAFKYSLFKNAPANLFTHRAVAAPGNLEILATATKEPVMSTLTSVKETTQDIFSRCRSANLSMEETEKVMMEAKGDGNKARDIIINMMADRAGPETRGHLPTTSLYSPDPTADNSQIVDALAARLGASIDGGGDNPYMNCSMLEIGRRYYAAQGQRVSNMSDAALAERMTTLSASRGSGYATMAAGMHTTTDFPSLLLAAGQRYLLERYNSTPSPLKALSTKRSVADFRPQTFIRPGEAPKLEKVTEAGEITYGTTSEDSNGLQISTYAKLFAMSRNAIINDNLGAFTDFMRAFSDSAHETEGDLFYQMLAANNFAGAVMSDGKPLYHADHGNLATDNGEPSVSTLSFARTAMRLQKNVNGTGTAGVVPTVLLVGPKLETTAEKIVAQLTATTSGDVNPFSGKLSVAVENRYDGVGWWLFADPGHRPAFQHGYLGGAEGPTVAYREGWNVLGIEFRCLLDFGCAPFDFRATYFNKGA